MSLEAKLYSTKEVLALEEAMKTLLRASVLTLEVAPEGFRDPPAIEIIRAIRVGYDFDVELLDRLTKFCVMGKTVSIKADGKVVGSPFVVTGLEDNWDNFDVFRLHPCLLQFLFSMAQDHVVKKSLPPQRNIPEVAAGQAQALSEQATEIR